MTPRARMVAVAVGLAVVLALGGCAARGGGAGPGGGVPSADAAAAGNGNVDIGEPLGGRPAPDFTLVNRFGQLMSLSRFRGKAVLLWFDDGPGTTVCPLTTQEMLQAKRPLGAAGMMCDCSAWTPTPTPRPRGHDGLLAGARNGEPVGLPRRDTGADRGGMEGIRHLRSGRAGGRGPHPGAVPDRPAGREQRIYLTAMAYSSISISRQAQIVAQQVWRLLPGHPALSGHVTLSAYPG